MIFTSDPLWTSGSSTTQSTPLRPSLHRPTPHEARAQRQLAERILAELRQDGHGELGKVKVDCDGHWVELTGRVSSFYLKQLAQEAVRRVAPGRQIFNEVQVVPTAARQRR